MKRILFANVAIFDGSGAKPYPGEVLVEGNRIAAVAPGAGQLSREGAEIVEGGGATLMPGMVEAHAHLSWPCVEDFGFTAAKALMAATKWGGEIMGMGDELGLVKQGYLADLLLVDGDPTADITIMQDKARLLMIMKDGAYHKAPPATRAAS